MIHQHAGADPKVCVSPFCREGTGFYQHETSHGYRTLPHPLRGQAFSEVVDSHERNRIDFLKEKNNKKMYTSQGKLSKSLCAIRKGLLGIERTRSFVCLMETVAVRCVGSGQTCPPYIARVVSVWESKTHVGPILLCCRKAQCLLLCQAEVPCTLQGFYFLLFF